MRHSISRRTPLILLALSCSALAGCSMLFDWGIDHGTKEHYQSTGLVDFLYGDAAAPVANETASLQLPIRVGLSFLPTTQGRSNDLPTAADKSALLSQVRERFRNLPYVTEIVIIPDYYLSARSGQGFEQAQQLARMFNLDLYALASYDQAVFAGENARSLGYLTIVGQFLFKGETHEAHTVVDLAVIEPRSRTLVLRAGGTAKSSGNSTLADDWRGEIQVRRKSFEQASASMMDNFAVELAGFEERVRAGTAPLKVARRGGGSLDLLALSLLLGALGWRSLRSPGVRAWRRT